MCTGVWKKKFIRELLEETGVAPVIRGQRIQWPRLKTRMDMIVKDSERIRVNKRRDMIQD